MIGELGVKSTDPVSHHSPSWYPRVMSDLELLCLRNGEVEWKRLGGGSPSLNKQNKIKKKKKSFPRAVKRTSSYWEVIAGHTGDGALQGQKCEFCGKPPSHLKFHVRDLFLNLLGGFKQNNMYQASGREMLPHAVTLRAKTHPTPGLSPWT